MKYDFTLPILELVDGELEVTPWALTVKEFRGIYEADKRKDKKIAVSTLMYIGICEDYSLWGLKMPQDKLLQYARKHCGILKYKKSWIPHSGIRRAREVYRDLQSNVAVDMQMLFIAEKAIMSLTRIVARIVSNADDILARAKIDDTDITTTKSLINKFMNTTGDLSERLSVIRDLQDKISSLRRQERIARIRGGGNVGPRENPEDSILNKFKDASNN